MIPTPQSLGDATNAVQDIPWIHRHLHRHHGSDSAVGALGPALAGEHDDDRGTDPRSRRGFEIAPVQLNLNGKDANLVVSGATSLTPSPVATIAIPRPSLSQGAIRSSVSRQSSIAENALSQGKRSPKRSTGSIEV
jgi:hypothetical protein